MKQLSQKKLTLAYLSALSIIALFAFGSYSRMNDALHLQRHSAMIINLSGRQRMWSQRIASLAQQYVAGDIAAKADLLNAVTIFEDAHRRLIFGDPAAHLPAMNDRTPEQVSALRGVYFDGSHPLDIEVGGFIRHARHLAVSKPESDDAKADLRFILMAARNPLLNDLNDAVLVYNKISDMQIDRLLRIQMGSLALVLATLLAEALGVFRPLVRRVTRAHEELLQLAMIDPLTGIYNRRSFLDRCATELSRARRYDQPTSFLMIDLDRFKLINDTYGHSGGDEVLKAFSRHLKDTLRPSDAVGRMGGEEFAICLADTSLANASVVADRIRHEITDIAVQSGCDTINFTVSIGVAESNPADLEPTTTLDQADKALYDAKRAGGNQVMASVRADPHGLQYPTVSIGFKARDEIQIVEGQIAESENDDLPDDLPNDDNDDHHHSSDEMSDKVN